MRLGRGRSRPEDHLPGDGLLLWHIDDSKPTNTDENHYKVGLVQADGLRNLEMRVNRGDGGDPFPGSKGVTAVSDTTTPNTKSYTGVDTCVSLNNIPASAASMTVGVTVRCGVIKIKDHKEIIKESIKDRIENKRLVKEAIKDIKELKEGRKDVKELKERGKDFKELKEGRKDVKELKEGGKDFKELKEGGKDFKELKEGGKDGKEFERPGGGDFGFPGQQDVGGAASSGDPLTDALAVLDQAVSILHAVIDSGSAAGYGAATPYIDASLRPDLYGGPTYTGADSDVEKRMAEGDPMAKREFDTPPLG